VTKTKENGGRNKEDGRKTQVTAHKSLRGLEGPTADISTQKSKIFS
jgi:hypothetical protein